jgi:hypothetical protein
VTGSGTRPQSNALASRAARTAARAGSLPPENVYVSPLPSAFAGATSAKSVAIRIKWRMPTYREKRG